MTRNDCKQLATTIGALYRSKEITHSGVIYFASQLSAHSASFKEEQFLKHAGVSEVAP